MEGFFSPSDHHLHSPSLYLFQFIETGSTFQTQQSMDVYSSMMESLFSPVFLLNKSWHPIGSVNALNCYYFFRTVLRGQGMCAGCVSRKGVPFLCSSVVQECSDSWPKAWGHSRSGWDTAGLGSITHCSSTFTQLGHYNWNTQIYHSDL